MYEINTQILNHYPPSSGQDAGGGVPQYQCICRENIQWTWDKRNASEFVQVTANDTEVMFNRRYSNGTAVVRSTEPMTKNQYYWELKMTQPVYGTGVMVGVGTAEAAMTHLQTMFVSRIGMDDQTWGLSHRGLFHHNSEQTFYSQKFEKGDTIGVHLDLWKGTLSFFKDRKPLGVASSGLRGKTLYAMASSTAACTGMQIIRSCSFPSGLQYLCAARLRELIPDSKNVLDELSIPPGLKKYLYINLDWLLDKYHLDDVKRCEYCLVVDDSRMANKYRLVDRELATFDEDLMDDPYGVGDNFLAIHSGPAFRSDPQIQRAIMDMDMDLMDSEDSIDSVERDNKRRRTSYCHASCSSNTDSD